MRLRLRFQHGAPERDDTIADHEQRLHPNWAMCKYSVENIGYASLRIADCIEAHDMNLDNTLCRPCDDPSNYRQGNHIRSPSSGFKLVNNEIEILRKNCPKNEHWRGVSEGCAGGDDWKKDQHGCAECEWSVAVFNAPPFETPQSPAAAYASSA